MLDRNKSITRAKLERQWRHDRDKARVIQFLIQVVKGHTFNTDAVIMGMVEVADYLSFSELTTRERRSLQGRLMRFVTALKC